MEENEKNLNKKEELEKIDNDGVLADGVELEESKLVEHKTPTDTAPQPTPVSERPIYRWNYEEQQDLERRPKRSRSSAPLVISIVSSCAFIVAFAILISILMSDRFVPSQSGTSGNQSPSFTQEKVIYVKEYDDESGILTHQEIYQKCLPSVVTISASNSYSAGIGSGFIISEDGYIATANHVINDMTNINVILSNGDIYEAEVIGGNEFTDIALLKINAEKLSAIKIGRSSDLLVGDGVVAIGTPAAIDFAGSFAEGAVSYNDRVLKIYDSTGAVQKKMTLIQTNALVNPGNSGCPLINEYGEAVGIISMKLNSTYYEGMCFAIPTDSAMPIINAMKNGADYEELLYAVSAYPAKLGITAQDASLNDPEAKGAEIVEFTSEDYDISRKMKAGDIIVGIDSASVSSVEHLIMLLDKYSPGDTVKLTFYRSGQKMTVYVLLGK